MLKLALLASAMIIAAPVEGQSAGGRDLAAVTGDQVVQAVDRDFPVHDADRNGALDQSEFAGWMVSLKAMSDPTATPDNPATQKWVGAAFSRADTDSNRSLSKAELLGLLAQARQG